MKIFPQLRSRVRRAAPKRAKTAALLVEDTTERTPSTLGQLHGAARAAALQYDSARTQALAQGLGDLYYDPHASRLERDLDACDESGLREALAYFESQDHALRAVLGEIDTERAKEAAVLLAQCLSAPEALDLAGARAYAQALDELATFQEESNASPASDVMMFDVTSARRDLASKRRGRAARALVMRELLLEVFVPGKRSVDELELLAPLLTASIDSMVLVAVEDVRFDFEPFELAPGVLHLPLVLAAAVTHHERVLLRGVSPEVVEVAAGLASSFDTLAEALEAAHAI